MPDRDALSRLNAALEGRYRIERQLGEGGMATVYLADDIRHERKVALKVLKPELAAVVGAERFLAEIKTTANLQHPHILPLFDSGEADNFLFYVMPYVEGESLRERLDREHQLPVDQAVAIATKVARALQAAHDRGVIHRDIKPANILLSMGEPLVSDFGIALAVGMAGGGRLTETGMSLGTPHYMSPEQATGDLSVGAATDVYALGCVLYEMLVGEPPYTGSTAQAVLGKIVTADADAVTKHRRSVPGNVDAAIRQALEKTPADRFLDAPRLREGVGRPGLQAWSGGGDERGCRPRAVDPARNGTRCLGGPVRRGRRLVAQAPRASPRGEVQCLGGGEGAVAFIAVVGREGGTPRELFPGTMARYALSGHIVYSKLDGTLNAVRFDLKTLNPIGEHVEMQDGLRVSAATDAQFALSNTGTLLYETRAKWTEELVWVTRSGAVEAVDSRWIGDFRTSALSPDGERFALSFRDDEGSPWDIWVMQLDGSRPRRGLSEAGGFDPAWMPNGDSLTFSADRTEGIGDRDLWTKRADGTGQARLQLDHRGREVLNPEWSRDGEWLLYATGLNSGPTFGDIYAIRPSQDTVPVEVVATDRHDRGPALSPDGGWLAYVSLVTGSHAIYVEPFPNIDGTSPLKIGEGSDPPLWSRDGSEIFYRNERGDMVVVTVETDPTFSVIESTTLPWGAEYVSYPHWAQYDVTPDGERFLMIRTVSAQPSEMFMVKNFFEELRQRLPN